MLFGIVELREDLHRSGQCLEPHHPPMIANDDQHRHGVPAHVETDSRVADPNKVDA